MFVLPTLSFRTRSGIMFSVPFTTVTDSTGMESSVVKKRLMILKNSVERRFSLEKTLAALFFGTSGPSRVLFFLRGPTSYLTLRYRMRRCANRMVSLSFFSTIFPSSFFFFIAHEIGISMTSNVFRAYVLFHLQASSVIFSYYMNIFVLKITMAVNPKFC